MARRVLILGVVSFALAACAGTGTDETDPIIDGNRVAPQRNLLLSDLNYGSPGNFRAVDEVFDLTTTVLRIDPSPDGSEAGEGPAGLVRTTLSQEGFGSGNTLSYTAANNIFTFDIDTEAGAFAQVFQNILFNDPFETDGLKNNQFGTLFGSDPGDYSSVFARFGVTPPDPGQSHVAYADYLTNLEEGDFDTPEEQELARELAEALLARTEELISFDQYVYSYSLPDGGFGQLWVTNMNDEAERDRTDTVAIVSLYEDNADGSGQYTHNVMGSRTSLPDVPVSGTATFQGKIVGSVLTNNTLELLTGGVSVDVDFAAGTMDMDLQSSIRVGGGQGGGTTFLAYKNLTGRGFIDGTTFGGDLTETDNGDSTGDFSGAFFGPVANEAGGTFKFGDESSLAHGAFTAAQGGTAAGSN